VGDALPFAIKLYETLLGQNPTHQGLILSTGSLFVMYTNAFVQGPADMLPSDRADERYGAYERAKKLYLRGAEILYRGLELKYPGWMEAAARMEDREDAEGAAKFQAFLSKTTKEDVASLYWAVAALLSAYSMDNMDLYLGFRLRELTAMIRRAYELDPDFNAGALDEFFVQFYTSVPEGMVDDPGEPGFKDYRTRAKEHFYLAVQKSKGLSAGPYLAYAEKLCVPAPDYGYEGDYGEFRANLEKVLGIDPDAEPALRLVNVLAQRKAQWLLDNASSLFLMIPED
jgi:predicted anti-sigma-YlaC factor YlaD